MNPRAFFVFLALLSGLHAQQLPAAPKTHFFDITPRPGYFNEPSIAVNPKNPKQLTVAWQVNASAAYSSDGGATWTIAEGTAPKEYHVSGDVSVAFDGAGRVILCYIAFDKLGTAQYWAHGATRNGIFVRSSADGGKTWNAASAVASHESTPRIPFEDKPYVIAGNGPHAGELYVGWTQFTLDTTEMLFSRSLNGGQSWSQPFRLNSAPGLPRDDNGALEGFNGVSAPDGTLYAIWDDRDGIVMAVSRDGGLSFTRQRRILKTGPAFFGTTGVSRSNGFPQIGIAPRSGRLYVAWSDYSNGDVDVFVASSADHGQTWSAPARVNNDPPHNGCDQFFQWMAVDPVSEAVNLIFYDRRADNRQTTVTLARSTDEGKTFANYAFDQESFEADGDFLGDYLALAAYGDKVFGAWAHQVSSPSLPAILERRKTRTVLRVGMADFSR